MHPIANIHDLVDAVPIAQNHLRRGEIWYRGHIDAAWRLQAKIDRECDRERENDLLQRFRMGTSSRHPVPPTMNDAAGWLSLARHHGLPTRLLDWTRSIFAATFFALEADQASSAAVWALSPDRLNEAYRGRQGVFLLAGPDVVDAVLGAFIPTQCREEVLAATANEVDLRMLLQQAAFTIHTTASPLDEMPSSHEYLMKFVIPAQARGPLLSYLRMLGFSRSTLFPDLSSLAEDIARTYGRLPLAPPGGAGDTA